MSVENAYLKLVSNLEELTKIYRHLLDVIRKEKDLLIQVDVKGLEESNKSKEAFLIKLRSLELMRERYAKDLARLVGVDVQNPRLLELAKKLQGPQADKLRSIHSALDLLLSQVTELNKENALYTDSALQKINGALNEVKDTVAGKKTYERQGKMTTGPDKSGNFVSKEA